MDILIFALYTVSVIVVMDSKLKEFNSGRLFIEGLESGAISIVNWRANADVVSDLKKVKRVLAISTAIMFVVAFIMMTSELTPNLYFSIIFFINLFIFLSLEWYLDIKRETLKLVFFHY